MEKVRVDLGERSYDIVIGTSCLDCLGQEMKTRGATGRALILTNPEINRLYGETVRAALDAAGIASDTHEFPEGEEHKQIGTIMSAYDRLIQGSYTRASTIVALGGGVVGDMAGFIAATYMRGVRFVQVPTTLLAMVDSSVGGKTGVNHPQAKNMIGAFYQPSLVLIDLDTLKSLPEREFRAGYAEVVKYGVIWDEALFGDLEKQREAVFALESEALGRIIRRSCEIKAEVVSKDEREADLRAILNFGHTFGHALEAVTDYKRFVHGEAVAIGMVAAARTAERLGMIDAASVERLEKHLMAAGLPARFPSVDVDALIARFQKDKKALEGRIRFVLPERIGAVTIRDDVPPETARDVIEKMTEDAD